MLRLQLVLALKKVSALPVLILEKENKNNIRAPLAPHSCWEEHTFRLTAVLLPAPSPHAHSSAETSLSPFSIDIPEHQKHRQLGAALMVFRQECKQQPKKGSP